MSSGRESRAIADAAIRQWGSVLQQLRPLIGDVGVKALYSRCLHLGTAAHPWLAAMPKPASNAALLSNLTAALNGRAADEAQAASAALFRTFTDLLTTLIGGALTNRLLASAGDAERESFPAKALDD